MVDRSNGGERLLTGDGGPALKAQSSMFTLFFIFLTCSFIVQSRAAPSPVSNLPLDRSCILLLSTLFIILSPATAESCLSVKSAFKIQTTGGSLWEGKSSNAHFLL